MHNVLRLAAKQPADLTKGWVPYYVFHIMYAKTGRRPKKSISEPVTPNTCVCTAVMWHMEFTLNSEGIILLRGRSGC